MDLIPFAEFAYKNSAASSVNMALVQATYVFYPHILSKARQERTVPRNTDSVHERQSDPKASSRNGSN